jgi:hypothetical protein
LLPIELWEPRLKSCSPPVENIKGDNQWIIV